MKPIVWLIAHEPRKLFERTARAFAERVANLTDGEIVIEPMIPSEYNARFNANLTDKTCSKFWDALHNNSIQMSQTQVHSFGRWDKNYRVFDMPFLFRDHDHATKVLEGPIGSAMSERLGRVTPLHGLSFTYSGGYRVFGANKPFGSALDLIGKRVRVNGNPVNADFVAAIGGEPHVLESYGYDEIKDGTLDVAETTYIRFLGKHVLKTEHNMFLTTIVINDQLWQTLDKRQQETFREAAIDVARLERQWSVEDAEEFEKNCIVNDVTITAISEEERQHFRELSESVYKKWEPYFMPGLVKEILRN